RLTSRLLRRRALEIMIVISRHVRRQAFRRARKFEQHFADRPRLRFCAIVHLRLYLAQLSRLALRHLRDDFLRAHGESMLSASPDVKHNVAPRSRGTMLAIRPEAPLRTQLSVPTPSTFQSHLSLK